MQTPTVVINLRGEDALAQILSRFPEWDVHLDDFATWSDERIANQDGDQIGGFRSGTVWVVEGGKTRAKRRGSNYRIFRSDGSETDFFDDEGNALETELLPLPDYGVVDQLEAPYRVGTRWRTSGRGELVYSDTEPEE
jgi:hypothetical protein